MEKLKALFYNPKEGLVSKDKLYKKVKEKGIDLNRRQVYEFYDNQAVNQVLKPIRRTKNFNSYTANYPGHIYQIDIIVYNRYMINKQSYILVVIDIYSRFMIAKAMGNRELSTIIKTYEMIIKEMGPPYELQGDNEFNKADFIKRLDKDGTVYRFSNPNEKHKNPIVERVNGTIAQMLQKIRITTKRFDWNNYLSDAVENYNTTIHSTTKEKPIEIFTGSKPNVQKIKRVENIIRLGDKVRIIQFKKTFSKGDVLTRSKDIYIVDYVKKNRIGVMGVDGTFKPYELSKVTAATEDDEIIQPETQTAQNKLTILRKQLDISADNIITVKRKPKTNRPDDFEF
jgi:Fe2+ or Zn2+ uptake regulation protein